ncbi:MAG: DMT family transporter [Pseudomonadota bacterium]
MTHPNVVYALVMFAAGIGIPVMASMNASIGTRFGSPSAAAILLLLVGGLISLAVFLSTATNPVKSSEPVPWFYYGAGIFVAFYILSITAVAPKFGLGNAVFFVLLGQLIAASLIDHFGWLGAAQSSLTLRRVLGLAVMAVGVYLARKPPV